MLAAGLHTFSEPQIQPLTVSLMYQHFNICHVGCWRFPKVKGEGACTC